MTLTRVFDAAYPPPTVPPGCGAVLGYIGRPGYTPHVWSPYEWQRFAHLLQMPAWVPNLHADPRQEARDACAAARALGWGDHFPEGLTRAIVFDFETAGAADREWWAECSDDIHVQGYVGAAYGSESTVFELAASWVWLAAWDGAQQLGEGQTVIAHQYVAGIAYGGTEVDYSVISPWLAARAGHGPRKLVP